MMSAARDTVAVGVEHNLFAAVELLLAKKCLVVWRRQREGHWGFKDVNLALLQTLFERSGRNRASCFCVWDAGFHSVHLLLLTDCRELIAHRFAFAVGRRHIIVDNLARGQDQKETRRALGVLVEAD